MMKKLFIMIVLAVICVSGANGQNWTEKIQENPVLDQLFVHPLGIEKAFSESNLQEVEDFLTKKGIAFQKINVPGIKDTINVTPENMEVGGVKIGSIALNFGEGLVKIMYLTEISENYAAFISLLEKELRPYSIKDVDTSNKGNTRQIYMLSTQCGIGVGANNDHKIGMAMLCDISSIFDSIAIRPDKPENE